MGAGEQCCFVLDWEEYEPHPSGSLCLPDTFPLARGRLGCVASSVACGAGCCRNEKLACNWDERWLIFVLRREGNEPHSSGSLCLPDTFPLARGRLGCVASSVVCGDSFPLRNVQQVARCSDRLILRNARAAGLFPYVHGGRLCAVRVGAAGSRTCLTFGLWDSTVC